MHKHLISVCGYKIFSAKASQEICNSCCGTVFPLILQHFKTQRTSVKSLEKLREPWQGKLSKSLMTALLNISTAWETIYCDYTISRYNQCAFAELHL